MHGNAPDPAGVDLPGESADLHLGSVVLRPASRELVGPAGTVMVEPKVMQVLMCLAASPDVVTRRQLERECWGNVASDEMINRAVAAARRALRAAGSEARLETIPRTGYRLQAPASDRIAPPDAEPVADVARPATPMPAKEAASRPNRRWLVSGGLAAAAAAVTGLYWQRQPSVPAARSATEQLQAAWRMGRPDQGGQMLELARQAVAESAGNAAAWGWLALAQRDAAEYGNPREASAMAAGCEASARRALALEPAQSQALTALATLPPLFGDWVAARQRLLDVLDKAPGDAIARDHLGVAEIAMGRVTAAAAISEALLADDPLAAVHQHKHIYRLWALGRLSDMDRLADAAIRHRPDHPGLFMARLQTLALTGRTGAARGMLAAGSAAMPLPPALALIYDQTFVALSGAAGKARQVAIDANLDLAQRGPGAAVPAINHLGALGALDEAFQVANEALRPDGPPSTAAERRRRSTIMLFLPSAASLRADPRFADLMEGIGLAREWARSGLTPDYQRAG